MEKDEAKRKITEVVSVAGKSSYSIFIEVRGRFLVDNHLVEAWSALRGHSIKEISSPGYTDQITLEQAYRFGILDFVLFEKCDNE